MKIMYHSTEIIKDQDPLSQSHLLYIIMVGVSYHCHGEMKTLVPRQYPMSWPDNDIEMRWNLDSFTGYTGGVSQTQLSWPQFIALLIHETKSRTFDEIVSWPYWGHPVLITCNIPTEPHRLVSIWVRTSCVITSPWSERGAPKRSLVISAAIVTVPAVKVVTQKKL